MSNLTHQTRAKFIDIALMALKRFDANPFDMDNVIFALHAVGIKPTIIDKILDDVMNTAQQDQDGVFPQHTRNRPASTARCLLQQNNRAVGNV